MSQQLVKKGANGRYDKVMPKSWIEAIKDKNTGQTLVEILQGFNMYFLPYNGNTSATRCLVPTMLRKKGLWITYVKYDGNVYTEWYAADELDDKSWGDSSNWRIGNNTLVGDITISANGNWVINGTETEFKAVGEKGNTPLLRVANNRLQVSYDLGDTYRDVNNNPVYTKFRWLATTGDTQANNVGRIQASTDEGKTWTNMSNDFTNNLHISRYIGVNESLPTSGIAEGTIYAKGPYYAEDDTLNDNPIYRLWVYAWKGNTLAWQDNGEFQSIAAGVVQETGDSETEVMSQKAVTDKLAELDSETYKLTMLGTLNYPVEINISGNDATITIRKGEHFFNGRKNLYLGEEEASISFTWSIEIEYPKIVYNKEKNELSVHKYSYITENNELLVVQFGKTLTDIRYVISRDFKLNGKIISAQDITERVSKKTFAFDAYLNAPFSINIEENNITVKAHDWIVVEGTPVYLGEISNAIELNFDFNSISGGYPKVLLDLDTKTMSLAGYRSKVSGNTIVLIQFGLTPYDIQFVFGGRYKLNGESIIFDNKFVENVNKLSEDLVDVSRLVYKPENDIDTFNENIGYENYQSVGSVTNWKLITGSSVNGWRSKIYKCKEGDKFVITGLGSTTARLYSVVDSNNVQLMVASGNLNVNGLVLEIPENADRICICIDYGNKPESSVVYIPKDNMYSLLSNNQWENKKCAFLGDSITYGERTSKTYWNYLKDRLGIIPTSYGVSGAKMNFLHTNEIPDMISSGVEYDAIFVFAGTNDFGLDTSMGNWYSESDSETNAYGNIVTRKKKTMNTDTSFKGSINSVLSSLRDNYPNSKIIILTPTHRGTFYAKETNQLPGEDYANALGLYIDDYVNAVKEASDIWSVYCIDLFAETGLYPLNKEKYRQYFYSSNDMLHPNAKGHEIIAKVIESHLRAIKL